MKRRMTLVQAGLLMLWAGCASTPPGLLIDKGLPNFYQVDDHLYRGGQPLLAGFDELAQRKIGTLVDLRRPNEKPALRRAEKEAVTEAGIEYKSEPLPGLRAPRRDAVRRVLAIINDPGRKKPVFIHCQRGADRTGTIVAIYRITHDCWSADRAIEEAREQGMSWVQFAMRRFIRDWYNEIKTKSCEERRLALFSPAGNPAPQP